MKKILLKDIWNRVLDVDGARVASVQWKSMPYMVIERDDTFEDCTKRDFIPILEYRTLAELNKAI